MKLGFSLIEVVLYIGLSTMVAGALFTSFYQTNRAVAQADALIDTDIQTAIALNQLEKDLSGACMPRFLKPSDEGNQRGASGARPASQPKKDIIIKDLFIAKRETDRITEFSFITCNPLQVYGKAVPRIVRVTYTVIADPNHAGLYQVLRQESTELIWELWQENPPRKYMILDAIKKLDMRFKIPKPSKQNKTIHISDQQEYETRDSWASPAEIDPKKPQALIPQYVTITLEAVDAQKRVIAFEVLIRIWAYESVNMPPQQEQKTDLARPSQPRRPQIKAGQALNIQEGEAVSGPFTGKPHMNKLMEQLYGRGAQ
ncbi:MAG: hypothetical protein WD068_02070 [Candidatus Babeliales bacterium]